MLSNSCVVVGCAAVLAGAVACAGQPAAPFDSLKTANLTAYRLQNYEPPPVAPGTAPGLVPGLPPEIQSWIQAGAQGLQQLIPPGLLPQGVLGGTAIAPGTAQDSVPRFHGFRILGQSQVLDPELKDKLGKLLGDPDSFDNQNARCAPNVLYAEMGLSFSSGAGMQPNDVLVSFSCNQVVSRSFSWPHPATGMKATTVKELSETVQQIFPKGT